MAMTILNITPSNTMTRTRIRRRADIFLSRIGRIINCWTAAAIARHERQAGLFALRQLNDRELKDIGLYRGDIVGNLAEAAKYRIRMQQTERR
jgi:uncharacterized protein YjiS (DUF1127 family)